MYPNVNNEDTFEPSSIYTAQFVGVAIQAEIKVMLYDYFTLSQPVDELSNNLEIINESMKDRKKFKDRFNRQMFHINTSQTSNVIQNAYLELNKNATQQLFLVNYNLGITGIVDKYAGSIEVNHKLLVSPTPANILIAFRLTSEFMQQMEEHLGGEINSFQPILNDFVLEVYIPQVIQHVNSYYATQVNGMKS
jgi:hypothetical protein